MNNQQLKAKILADIAAAKEKGYVVVIHDWGSNLHKCACALGCVAVSRGLSPEEGDMAEILEVSQEWVSSFIDGFDNNGYAAGALDPEAWKIGEEVRQETQPIPYDDFMNQKMDEELYR